MNRTLGGAMGYSSGRNSSSLNVPPSNGDCEKKMMTQNYVGSSQASYVLPKRVSRSLSTSDRKIDTTKA